MSVAIQSTALTGALWSKKPNVGTDGQLVEATFEDTSTAKHRFTAICYTPDDALRFVAADANGTVYIFSLKKNRYTVIARLNTVVQALSFGKDKNTVHAAGGMLLFTINTDTARIESRVKTPHNNNMQHLTTPILIPGEAQYSTKFVSCSKDSLTLWSVGDGTAAQNPRPVEGGQMPAGASELENLIAASGSPVGGSSTAAPLPVARADTSGFFNSVAMTEHHLYAVDSVTGCVCCYATKGDARAKGVLDLVARITVGQGLKVLNLALSQDYLMVGTKTSQARVLFLKPISLEGISAVSLPLPKEASPTSTTIASVSVCPGPHAHLAAAQLSDGKIWFLNVTTYAAFFSIRPKLISAHPTIGSLIPGQSSMAFGSDEYLGLVYGAQCLVFHLRTAKAYFDRHSSSLLQGLSAITAASSGVGATDRSTAPENRSALPFVRGPQEKGPHADQENEHHQSAHAAPCGLNESNVHPGLTRTVLSVDSSKTSKRSSTPPVNPRSGIPANVRKKPAAEGAATWVKVNLIDRAKELKALTTEQQPLLAQDAMGEAFGGKKVGEDAAETKKPSTLDKKKAKPVSGSGTASKQPPVTLRPFLDKDSQVLNFEKLRGMLMKFGVFPERYRPLIWRFLLQIPDKNALAPSFHSLSTKGLHPGVPALIKPYPLPDSRLRVAFEKVLSALAYHAPVFSVTHWVPAAVFPFVKMFGSDVQSSVEICLSFFLNWGQEWFVYYPHPPVAITNFVNHTLKGEDMELWQHLQECAVGTDDWVWAVMQPVYSEVLSRGEWLQLMDHAIANEPIWLFLFHVRWMIAIRDVLLGLQDHGEVQALLRRNIPIDFNKTLQQTYRLHSRLQRNELTEPYQELLCFDETGYPTTLVANDCVVTSKLRELEKIEEHEKQVVGMKQRTSVLEKQLAQAAMLEDAFVSKQKALVAAKFDASNSIWEQQVSLEKERQHLRDIEQGSRLDAVEEQLRSAHRLHHLQEEVKAANNTIKDAEVDRQRETMKWDFADKMTHFEMQRIEEATKGKLRTSLTLAHQDLHADRDLHQSLAAEHRLPVVIDRTDVRPGSQHLPTQQPPPQQHQQPMAPTAPSQVPQQQYAAVDVSAATDPHPEASHASSRGNQPDVSTTFHSTSQRSSTSGVLNTSNTATPPVMPPRQEDAVHMHPRPDPLPPASTVTRTSTSPPQSTPPQGSSRDTSVPTSSSAHSDPVAYYDRLRKEVKQGVLKAQAEQRAALGHLKSNYTQGGGSVHHHHHYQQHRHQQHEAAEHQLYDDAEDVAEHDDNHLEVSEHHDPNDDSANTEVTEYDETMTSGTGGGYAHSTGSSMYKTLMRPQPRSTYDVVQPVAGGGGATTTTGSSVL